jgi:transposase-like protein
MSHANATLTPAGRLKMARLVVEKELPLRLVAGRFSVSTATVRRWTERYREYGEVAMLDRSSRPHRCPHQLPRRVERRIVGLRITRRWGPARIAGRVRSSV